MREWSIRHISEESPEYQEHEKKSRTIERGLVFGERELLHLKKLSTDPYTWLSKENVQKDMAFYSESPKNELLNAAKSSDQEVRERIRRFFEEAAANQIFKRRLSEIAQCGEDQIDAQATLGLLEHNLIPQDFFEEILETHIAVFKEEQRQFGLEIRRINSEFEERVTQAMKSGLIPSLDAELIKKRITETEFFLQDWVYAEVGTSESFSVVIPASFSFEERRHAVFHELIHTISGKTIIEGTDLRHQYTKKWIEFQRVGFRFRKRAKGGEEDGFWGGGFDPQNLYIGLNEAVTEMIAMDLLNDPKEERGFYIIERARLNRILEHIPRQLLLDAYFENYNADPNKSEKLPSWKKLIEFINAHPEAKQLFQKMKK